MDIIDSFNRLPIGKYMEIQAIAKDESLEEIERQAQILSVLTGETEDEILHLPIVEYKELVAKSQFLNPENIKYHPVAKKYIAGGYELIPVRDFRKLETCQYIDFQTFAPDLDNRLVEFLSVILVPKGHRYNEGYDILDVQKAIREDMSIADGTSVAGFFFDLVQQINSGYSELLTGAGEGDQGQEEAEGDPGADPSAGGGFEERWGWIANVDAASETCRCSWDELMRWPAVEFLNILAYRKDKNEEEKRKLDEWKRRH